MKNHLETDYNITKIPDLHLKNAIDNLTEAGVLSIINQKLDISQVKRNEIKKSLKETRDLENQIKDDILKSLHEKIPSISTQQCELILEKLSILLGTTFARYGTTSARILTEGMHKLTELKKQKGFQEIYQNTLLSIISEDLRDDLDKFFNEYFGNPDEKVSIYLFSRAQSYVYFKILNLDPDLQSFQKDAWAKKYIYLDTNTFMDLIFEDSTSHNTIETIIAETQNLGAQILITEKTAIEFESSIENSKRKYNNFRVNPKFTSTYKNAQKTSQFLSTYSHELLKNPKLTMETFYKRYQEFKSLMDSKYNIILEELDKDIDLEDEDALRLKTQILNFGIYKNSELVNHDAYNILRVHKLRDNKPDVTGHKTWLLTTDYGLPRAERGRYGQDFIYASVTPEIWLQMISPFVAPETTINNRSIAFTKLLSSNFKSHKIPLEDLSNLLSIFWNTEGIDQKHLEIIIGNDFIKEHLLEMRESLDKGEEISLAKFEPMMKKGLELIQEDFDKKIDDTSSEHKKEMGKMQTTIDELNQMIQKLSDDKTKTEGESIKIKSSFKYVILAIIGSIVVDIVFYLGLNSIPNFEIQYVIIPIIGLIGIESTIIFKLKP